MASNPNAALIVIPIVVGYVGFLAAMITWAVRATKRRLAEKSSAFEQALVALGARKIAEGPSLGTYRGREIEYELEGSKLFANAYYVNRYYVRVNLRVPVTQSLPWTAIYPEGRIERFGKTIGLNREVQTGDPAFDELAYVDTIESDEAVAALLAKQEVRDAIRDLLAAGYKVQISSAGVETYQLVANRAVPDTSRFSRVLGLLQTIASNLPSLGGAVYRATPQGKLGLPLVASMLIWLPAVGVMVATSTAMEQTMDPGGGAFAFVAVGGLGWVLYTLGVGMLWKGRSYAIRLVMIASLMGLFAVPMAVGGLVLWLNQRLDVSVGETKQVSITKLGHHKSDYYVYTTSWRGHDREKVDVPRARWQKLKVGDPVTLIVHPGSFGWTWAQPVSFGAPEEAGASGVVGRD